MCAKVAPPLLAWFVALALLAASSARAADSLFSFDQSGELRSGTKFSVRVAESAYQRGPTASPDDGSWWGIDGGFPSSHCTTFEVAIDGARVPVVRKLYEDLSHLTGVEVSEEGGHLVLLVRGGDGSGSFRAQFVFRKFEVERTVRGGEAPDGLWERTVYHNSLPAEVD